MYNCLILGSGRSGTSMVGGILENAGYFLGDDLYPARDSNPKGFFENAEINGINESILERYDSKISKLKKILIKKSTVKSPSYGQRWLSCLSVNTNVNYIDQELVGRIKSAVDRQPFGYKDPRFSYTLPVWKNFLPKNTRFLVIFREPDVTANSIVKECSDVGYLKDLLMDNDIAVKTWVSVYSHVLKNYYIDSGNFLFVHYDQIYSGTGLRDISKFLHAEINNDFVEKSLKRSKSGGVSNKAAKDIYVELCQLAKYDL